MEDIKKKLAEIENTKIKIFSNVKKLESYQEYEESLYEKIRDAKASVKKQQQVVFSNQSHLVSTIEEVTVMINNLSTPTP